MVEFGLLGGIEAAVDRESVDLGPVRQRSVLAALLVDVNRVVTVDQLIDRVWGESPPQRSLGTLYSYISRLRRALPSAADEVRLVRQAGGYVLTVTESAVDLYRFRGLVTQAHRTDDDERAVALFEQALGLWQGDAFSRVDTPWFNTLRESLHQERLTAELDLGDVQLRLGRHSEVLARLFDRAAAHPLDERLAGQLMLALYRSGRAGDALAHYQRVRRCLAEELGTDPGLALRELYQQILTVDPALAARSAAGFGPARPPVPRQLPAPPSTFTGRTPELAHLDAVLEASADQGGAVVISAISGAGGIGKTWLALHWAHQQQERFPDGQLYANLRGFDPVGEPVTPQTALRGFLDAFGTDPATIPAGAEAQAALYRSLTADKQLLIVLDNARDGAQVLPLLPGSPTCTVLITSRNRLTGLTATHGARPLTLDVLTEAEARQLLTRHLGAERAAAEPDAVNTLLAHCGGLPLAISILGARASAEPGLALAVLAGELLEMQTRLDALDTGDITADLRTVFATSYHALDPRSAQAFRLLSLTPGADISLPAAAGLTGLPTSQVRGLLRILQAAHLIQEHTPGRYRIHDLTRLYATERAQSDDPAHTRDAALQRLLDLYLHTARAAIALVDPRRKTPTPATPAPPSVLTFADYAQAVAWLEAERGNLAAAVDLAQNTGLYDYAWQLPGTLWPFYFLRGYLTDWISTHQTALTAVKKVEETTAHAETIHNLAIGLWQSARYSDAADAFKQAVEFRRQLDDMPGVAASMGNLAIVSYFSGRYDAAMKYGGQSLELRRQIGDPYGEAVALTLLSGVMTRMGRLTEALDTSEHARALFHQAGDQHGEAGCLINLSTVHERLGQHAQAIDFGQRGLAAVRQLGHRGHEVKALMALGAAHTRLGDHPTALEYHQEALFTAEGLTDPGQLAALHIEHALSRQAAGHHDEALHHYRTGLDLAEQAQDPYERARAHQGIADTLDTLDQTEESRRHRKDASVLFADLGIPPLHTPTPPANEQAANDDTERRT